MKYGIVFGLLALVTGTYAIALGGWAIAMLWPAISFGIVAVAYAINRPELLGKRRDGRMAPWSFVLNGPYVGLTLALWHAQRFAGASQAAVRLAPGLWIGRRPLGRELPPGVSTVIDLTAEMPAASGILRRATIVGLPILDAGTPAPEPFRKAVREVAALSGDVLIHCALGHGRTGMFAAAVLIVRGLADDFASALAMLQTVRPQLRCNAGQRMFLEAIVPMLVKARTGGES